MNRESHTNTPKNASPVHELLFAIYKLADMDILLLLRKKHIAEILVNSVCRWYFCKGGFCWGRYDNPLDILNRNWEKQYKGPNLFFKSYSTELVCKKLSLASDSLYSVFVQTKKEGS